MFKRKFRTSPTKFLSPYLYSTHCPDEKIVTSLQSCKNISEITPIHGLMVKTGLDQIPFTLSKLLACSIQDINYAGSIFKHIQKPNLYMFNTILRAYSISENQNQVFVLFNYLRAQRIVLDEFTFVPVLKSCCKKFATWTGLGVHSIVLKSGFQLFLNVKNTLLHFYCVCQRMGEARKLFDEISGGRDLIPWNILMGGYLCASQNNVVLDLFKQLCTTGQIVGKTTILSVISAAGELNCVLTGECLHGYCIKFGFCLDLNVVSALISMYGKMGCIDSGSRVFAEVSARDVVVWNCLIDGYAKGGLLDEALGLLGLMKLEEVKPNSSTLAGLLSACASSGTLALGQRIHDYVEVQEIVLDAILGTALVDMYAKCGLLSMASNVFDMIEKKDVKCWTAMILGYGVNGEPKNAITLFHRMEQEDFKPNEVTFLAVLNACSHGGLVTDGISCFRKMVQHYGLTPRIEHYGCIIDLLGRAGLLEDAHELIKSLPIEGDATAWRALLAACRVHGNVELGKLVKGKLETLYDEHPADSLVLTSTYAIAGRIPDSKDMLENKGNPCSQTAKKEAGSSIIQLSNKEWELEV
ncbi:unnamed protein product [Coffea canephora]|uniref:Pentacotripeptide-repeat region of PRORP domain-containing protein n=1 Tax=Coffea canephora TaxID=49390 RepID=A0A068TVP5_COFCA|nr:unnamed protein product [Coffea canephora]